MINDDKTITGNEMINDDSVITGDEIIKSDKKIKEEHMLADKNRISDDNQLVEAGVTDEKEMIDRGVSPDERKRTARFLNGCTIVGLLLCAAFAVYGFRAGIFSSKEALESFLGQFGIWGPVIFVAIQAVQVVIPILPGAIGCVAGVLVFGPWMGFVYNYIGISVGSVLAFLIAKRCGSAFVQSLVKPATYNKYADWLEKGKKFDKLFALAIFLPVAPDDFLCYLAGLTRMTVQKFTAIIVLCKPASIFLYSIGLTSVTQLVTSIFK